jgi:DNA-binding NarL/FixJ family response regulator
VTIRVVLVDDQALIRAGFRAIVDSAPDLEVVGESDDGATALAVIRDSRADVVLMDVRMPGRDGIATTRAITTDDDLAGVRVIVLTTFELDEYVVDAMRAGASGFLDKGVDPAVLLDAIRVVAGGDALLTPNATRALLASMTDPVARTATIDEGAVSTLTGREREVVAMVGRGLSNDDIADALYLSPLTVKTHVSRAMTKLHARDRAQLVVLAFRSGLTRLDDLE